MKNRLISIRPPQKNIPLCLQQKRLFFNEGGRKLFLTATDVYMKFAHLAVAFSLFLTVARADDAVYTAVLQESVHDGAVRYRTLCKDPGFVKYVQQLSVINPDSIANREARLAYWINVYNSWTLKAICDHYPVKSINDLNNGGTIWDKDFVQIHGGQISLNKIEHEIIRKGFAEPRAHFALVCASRSCPTLRPEAYNGPHLIQQMEDQGRIFFSDPKRNSFDRKNKTARLSRILDWYANDFGKTKEERLSFVARFLPEDLAASIRSDPSAWKMEFLPYDWSLNDAIPGSD